jgi:hypothetical protein
VFSQVSEARPGAPGGWVFGTAEAVKWCNSSFAMEPYDSALGSEPATAAARPLVVEGYWDYTPPFDATEVIEGMLRSVPQKYLLGLKEVVLTNKNSLPRKRRRSVTKSRGRKVKIAAARGAYHQAWKGKQAWIEIFVDNALSVYDKGFWRVLLHFGYFRESELGGVLFHEIGHHIDATLRPEFRDKEDIADDWSMKFKREWFREKRPVLRRVFRLFGPIMRIIFGLLAERLLARGEWTRTKYDKKMKKIHSYK